MTFKQIIRLDAIPPEGWRGAIAADPSDYEAIVKRLKIQGIARLKGEFKLHKTGRGVHLYGTLDAVILRECIASLETFEEEIVEPFEIEFAREIGEEAAEEIEIDANAAEPLTGESLDLAEILVQQLSLAMHPWPRKPGAVSLADDYAPTEAASPFAVLKSKIADPGEQG